MSHDPPPFNRFIFSNSSPLPYFLLCPKIPPYLPRSLPFPLSRPNPPISITRSSQILSTRIAFRDKGSGWFSVYVIMGHRHGSNTPEIFETNHDQYWNHMHSEDPFVHLDIASSNVVDSNSFLHPVDNLQTDGVRFVSHWNPNARVNEISSSSQIGHVHRNQSEGVSRRDSLHSAAVVDTFHNPDNYVHPAPSSNYVVDNNAFDLTMSTNGRGQYKRKSPMVPSINEAGSTSGYLCAGSSSNASYERQNIAWEPISMPPIYNPPVGGESSLRNVRSRSSFDLDPELFRSNRVMNYPHHPSSSRHLNDHCNPVDHSTQGPILPALERNHVHISSASHGRTINADSSNLNQDASYFINGSSTPNISGQVAGYGHDLNSSRNPAILQRFNPTPGQTRGTRSNYPQRSIPTNRAGIGSFQLGQVPPLEEGLRSVAAENFPNRYPRAFTSAGWRNNDRIRSRPVADRYRSSSVDTVSHDHMTREGLIAIGRSSFHAARSLLDQHRELRVDVDNMSYEELLALGERIGSVNTGLSDDQIFKCLKEAIYLTTEQGEERCVICLEEYQDMDQIGSLKSCRHEYHSGCIKKWLSLKNLCPICKAPALPDDMKEKEKLKAPI